MLSLPQMTFSNPSMLYPVLSSRLRLALVFGKHLADFGHACSVCLFFILKRMKLLGRNFFRKFFSLACVMIKPPTTAVSEVVLAAADIYRLLSSSLSHPLITRQTSRRSTLASDFSATEEATICRSIVFINLSFVLIIW